MKSTKLQTYTLCGEMNAMDL